MTRITDARLKELRDYYRQDAAYHTITSALDELIERRGLPVLTEGALYTVLRSSGFVTSGQAWYLAEAVLALLRPSAVPGGPTT